MMKTDFFFDFETRSRKDIKTDGLIHYATDESTEATLLTYTFGRTGQLKYWRYGQDLPEDLVQVIERPAEFNHIAYNLEFDYMIWLCCFVPKVYGRAAWPIPLENLHDAAALTAHFRVGHSLEKSAEMLGLGMSKDSRGRQIMLKQCKINKRTGKFPELTEEEWADFVRYGLMDTRLLREVYYRCPRLPHSERWVWEWTFRRNLRGIRVDVDLINELNSIVKEHRPRLEHEFKFYTGGNFSTRSAKRCKEWFQQYWPGIESMRKDVVRDMLLDLEGKPEHAVKALRVKEMAGSSSIAKVDVAVRQTYNGRIYGLFVYHKAQTKRWAGQGIQIQNLPRPDDKPVDDLGQLTLNSTDLAGQVRRLAPGLMSPLTFVKNLLRRIWIPMQGNILYCGDFSKVEPTVLRWLAGMGEIPPLVYEEMAEAIYNIPLEKIGKDSEERQIGKAAELGGGYGMGYKKFRKDTFEKTGIILTPEMARHVISTYRQKNAPIAEMWRNLEAAFRRAINGESVYVCGEKVLMGPMSYPYQGVQIRLPSGGMLYYHKAKVEWEEETQEIVTMKNGVAHIEKRKVLRENIKYLADKDGRVCFTKLYGGMLTEHITSAISRELLAPAMWRLEQNGFDVLSTIHDEIWGESYPGRDEEFRQLMIALPPWADGIVIDAGLDNGLRYLK